MAKYFQNLAREVLPDHSFESTDNLIQGYLNSVYRTPERQKLLSDPKVYSVYANYAYDVHHDYNITDHDHYNRCSDDWDTIFIGVSDNAHLESYVHYATENGYRHEGVAKVKFVIDGKSITFPERRSIDEIHKAAMIYTYAVNKLKTMPTEKGYGSRYHNIKLELENYFKSFNNGDIPEIDLDNMLTKQEMEECISVAKASALKQYLIRSNVIPQEKGLRKYPKTFDKLARILPKVVDRYTCIKRRKVTKAIKKEQKALIKKQNKELKIAHIKEARLLKEKQKQETTARKRSVKEADFSNS